MRTDLGARAALAAAAAVPFLPAAMQFLRRGVPDYLFTGDAATIEIRVLHAAHGAQLLGPYSRFQWSHPGPAFFYLALPIYEAFHERGPALNLFMFLVNLAGAIAVVLIARRLRGDAFAWLTAGLLAVFELVALPFVQTGEWNPVAPILPLVVLSFLGARIALGGVAAAPVFALIASAIVQTHLGFAPEVAALCAVAVGVPVVGWIARAWPNAPSLTLDRREWTIAAATAGMLTLCWLPPLYEAMTNRPGNLGLVYGFFIRPHATDHSWTEAFSTLFAQLSIVPVAAVRSLHVWVPEPGPMTAEAIALAQIALAGAALAAARRARDTVLAVFTLIALAEIVAALLAVRGVRGDLLPYLVLWMAVPGLMTVVAAAAWLMRDAQRWTTAAAIASTLSIALTLTRPEPFAPVMRDRDAAAEQLARDVAGHIRSTHLDRPIIRIASNDAWPATAAVVLHLRKERIPFFVEGAWGFMFGTPLAPDTAPHPSLIVANRAFDDQARSEPQLSRVAGNDAISVYLEPPRFLDVHRLPPPTLSSAVGVNRDPRLVVDGVIPMDGTPWDSAVSAVFASTSSTITVEVPRHDVAGMFASVDGNDLYAIHCLGGPARSWSIGVRHPEEGVIGMQTRMFFDDTVAQCSAVEIRPESGDGLYSLAEIGFLRR